jgi:hypothetical protein
MYSSTRTKKVINTNEDYFEKWSLWGRQIQATGSLLIPCGMFLENDLWKEKPISQLFYITKHWCAGECIKNAKHTDEKGENKPYNGFEEMHSELLCAQALDEKQ